MTKRIIVLGIGNIVLSDEGFGVRVMEKLRDSGKYGEDVEFIDGGTLGMELLPFVTGADCLLILDAVSGGGKPGQTYRFAGPEVAAHFAEKLSVHEIGIQDVLMTLDLTGKAIPVVTVIGAEPLRLEAGMELSEMMQAVLPEICQLAEIELNNWTVKK